MCVRFQARPLPTAKQRASHHPCLTSFCWFWPVSHPALIIFDLSVSCVPLIIPAVGHLDSFYLSFKSLAKLFNKPGPRIEPCVLPWRLLSSGKAGVLDEDASSKVALSTLNPS